MSYMTLKEKAKEIRKVLKKEFPDVKFSVRKSSESAIYVRYNDALPVRFVEEHVRQFENIHYDQYSGEILSGGNDFIFVNREISSENEETARALVDGELTHFVKGTLSEYDKQKMLYGFLGSTDFRKPVTIEFQGGSLLDSLVGNIGLVEEVSNER